MALVPWLPTCSRGGIILPFNGLWDYQDHNFFCNCSIDIPYLATDVYQRWIILCMTPAAILF